MPLRRCKQACENTALGTLRGVSRDEADPSVLVVVLSPQTCVCVFGVGRVTQAAQAAQAQLASMSLRSQTLPAVHFQQPSYSHPPPSYSSPPPPPQQAQFGGWAQYGGGAPQPNYAQAPPPAYDPHTAPGAQPAPSYYHHPPAPPPPNGQYYQQPPPQQQQQAYGYGGQPPTYPQYQYPPQ